MARRGRCWARSRGSFEALTRRAITAWMRVHTWSSLVCTAFLLFLCVTGLPLIFHEEIDAAVSPAQPLPAVAAATKPLDLDQLLARALAGHPRDVPLYMSFDTDRPVVNVTTGPAPDAPAAEMRFQSLDRRTGAVLPRARRRGNGRGAAAPYRPDARAVGGVVPGRDGRAVRGRDRVGRSALRAVHAAARFRHGAARAQRHGAEARPAQSARDRHDSCGRPSSR